MVFIGVVELLVLILTSMSIIIVILSIKYLEEKSKLKIEEEFGEQYLMLLNKCHEEAKIKNNFNEFKIALNDLDVSEFTTNMDGVQDGVSKIAGIPIMASSAIPKGQLIIANGKSEKSVYNIMGIAMETPKPEEHNNMHRISVNLLAPNISTGTWVSKPVEHINCRKKVEKLPNPLIEKLMKKSFVGSL